MTKIGKHETYVRIVGEPYLARARAYKAAKITAEAARSAFAIARGATYYSGLYDLESLTFPKGKVPPGWSRPNRRGRSRPLPNAAGKAEAAAMAALPKMTNAWDVFPEAEVPAQINYRGPGKDDRGGGGFSNRWAPEVLWILDDFYGLVGDVASAAREHLVTYPKSTIEDGALDWVLPAGLERITEAEWEFAVAKYNLDREMKVKAA